MRKLRLAVLAVVLAAGTSVAVAVGTAAAQQVCDPQSLAGGEACFYSGAYLSGREFDVSVPLTQQLPLSALSACVDLPEGYSLDGSVTNASPDTLYVFASDCPDSTPGIAPTATIAPHHTGNLRSLDVWTRAIIRSVRMCAPGLVLSPATLDCAYPS